MKRLFQTIGLIIITNTILFAQVTEPETTLKEIQEKEIKEGWVKGGLFSLGFSQVSLTNWASGGQNSLSGDGLLSVTAGYGKKDLSWENTLDVAYGMVRQGKDELIKSEDKIDFFSKLGLKAIDNWHYASLLNFRTQMAPGYNYPNDSVKISDLLAPAYIVGAIGMDYKRSDNFSLFLAPLTGKVTIVNDKELSDAGAFGIEPGETVMGEFGGYIKTAYKIDITEDMSFQTKLDIFSNYLEKPQNLDINWETMLLINFAKYITIRFATHLVYDDNIKVGIDTNDDGEYDKFGPRTQFKQFLSVGLSYKF